MKYGIWVAIIALIIARYFIIKPTYKEGDSVRITSTIYIDPIRYDRSQYIKLAGLSAFIPLFPEVYYGDRVVIEGVVNEGKLDNAKLIDSSATRNFLSKFRNRILDFYGESLPQPESGLLGGIVLGSKGALTREFYDSTKLIGLTHVIVASGTNVTFVVSFLMNSLVLFISRRRAVYIVILGIIFYLFMSGFQAPLIRAAIMSSVLFLSQEAGRVVSTWRIYFLTAGVMLIINPFWISDMGFILSFVATGSLMFFENPIKNRVKFLPGVLREAFSTSMAAQIGVLPILFVVFRQFNILSVVVNSLVLWTVPFIMIIGAVGGLLQSKWIIYLAYPFLKWFTDMVWVFTKITGLFTL